MGEQVREKERRQEGKEEVKMKEDERVPEGT